jgi:hypothetical protein
MCGLLRKNMFRAFTLILSVPLFGLGCGNLDTGGSEDSGSIFKVEYIDPTYFEDSTNQVDVIQGNCADPGEPIDWEPYTDHFADVTLSNRPLSNTIEQTASTIYVNEYYIWYEPLTQGSPELPSSNVLSIRKIVGLEPCLPHSDCQGETVPGIEFVPVREKEILRQYIESTGIFQLEYNVYYRFFGENDFGYDVSCDGFTNFYAANYDNCGGG